MEQEVLRKNRFWAVYITITIEAVLDNLSDGKKLRDVQHFKQFIHLLFF